MSRILFPINRIIKNAIFNTSYLYYFALILLVGCSGLEQGEQEKFRRQNAHAEVIYRRHDEIHYEIPPLQPRVRENYPWEEGYVGRLPPITKEWFRCRGSGVNPPHMESIPGQTPVQRIDCAGAERHSLPLRKEEEFIYPVLIEILNNLQSRTGQKIVVTCGYRCPQHNVYADPSPKNAASKHMIGAEVDFYVQGFEERPEEVVKLIMQFYRENARYRGKKEYQNFERYEKKDTDVSTLPWYNKEIFIKLYRKNEGRDFDNRHPYPYISLQVRVDRETNEKVVYTWQKANSCYKRY